MRNEKGLTLVELLAVIVILAIISIIATVTISKVINNAKADAHLANARNVLAAGKMAHMLDEPLNEDSFYNVEQYKLEDLAEMGYLQDVIKSPTFFSWWKNDDTSVYDMSTSRVEVDNGSSTTVYKVALSIGGLNMIFLSPVGTNQTSLKLEEIKRENFSKEMKTQLGIP